MRSGGSIETWTGRQDRMVHALRLGHDSKGQPHPCGLLSYRGHSTATSHARQVPVRSDALPSSFTRVIVTTFAQGPCLYVLADI